MNIDTYHKAVANIELRKEFYNQIIEIDDKIAEIKNGDKTIVSIELLRPQCVSNGFPVQIFSTELIKALENSKKKIEKNIEKLAKEFDQL
ncbi:hypothetical protein ACFO4P_17125 [Epilithonimonas pallida]|uniref:Uncharacterized protein n=1 Tax=Epilithonimonas pallida TaxID=373671 RepID=A0ABY1R404_9FLAO|nr:hypothetical protein [Epilithonimonas pallida]SMP94711.1 hypothetical protein SAMN05421679_106110 [Epilithonimonas pallida]